MRTLQTLKLGNWRIKCLRLLIGRATDKKKIHRSRFPLAELFFSHAKNHYFAPLIFLALHKHLPHSRFSFQTCMSKSLLTFSKPCSHQEAALAQPTIPSLALMEGYHSKHQVMNLCMMANLLNQLSWRYLRFNSHWSNTAVSFNTPLYRHFMQIFMNS